MSLGVTGKLVLAFITLLLGAVLIGVVATQGLAVTDKDVITGEQHAITVAASNVSESTEYTVTKNPTSWKIEDCPLTNFAIKNASGGTALTLTTDYTVTLSTGVFQLVNTSTTEAMIVAGGADNSTYIDYTYCPDDYMNSTWGRTGIDLVAGFFALGILGASLGLFFSVAKETGML